MPTPRTKLRRRLKGFYRDLRGAREVVRAMASTDHPFLAHIIPIRRCNLSCTYCNEFDDFSKPVAARRDVRAHRPAGRPRAPAIITFSGGEPLLHPELDDIIRRIRQRGMIAGMITNGYLLSPSASSA